MIIRVSVRKSENFSALYKQIIQWFLGVFGINTSCTISKLSQISLAEAARDILEQF